MRATLALTLAVVVTAVVPAAAAEPGVPPWFDWVKKNPEATKWVTTDSECVRWVEHYTNWVRAAKYILYVFPKKHPVRDIDYHEACREVYNVWAGSDAALIDELKRTDVSTLPNFGHVNWSVKGDVSEGTFYEWVKSGRQYGQPYACDWESWKESDLMKAAVRIAYWVASWIPYRHYRNYRSGGHPERVLEHPEWRWNCCDHAALAVALMRAAGIPAKPVLGGPKGDDHTWVEVYNEDGTWVPVDPTGNAGEWYCKPKYRQGWISKDDFEYGVHYYAISIDKLTNAWKQLYTQSSSGGESSGTGNGIPLSPLVVAASLGLLLVVRWRTL